MRAQLPSEVETATYSLPSKGGSDLSISSDELQMLGARLRATYAPVEEPLPVRLAKLVEQLSRREQIGD